MSSAEPSRNLVKSRLIPEQRNLLVGILARNACVFIGPRGAVNILGAKAVPTCHLLCLDPTRRSSFLQPVFPQAEPPGEKKGLLQRQDSCRFGISLQTLNLMQCENYYPIAEES